MVSAIPAASLSPEKLATQPMPEHRATAFRLAVASRMRTGVTPAMLVREQQALCTALADPAFEKAMAIAYAAEMGIQQPNPKYRVAYNDALNHIKGILANRIADAQQFIAMLGDAKFVSDALAESQKPEPPKKEYDLPPIKKEEIIESLNPGLTEPAVHVAANAQGQRETHMALANIFRSKVTDPIEKERTLRDPLIAALTRAWPEATEQQREQLAVTWLKARHDPAHSVADGLTPGTGELYEEVMRRTNAKHQPTVPAAQVAVPATTPAKLQTADIMMDTI